MIITFHGNQYIKLQTGNTVIACNPDVAVKGSKDKTTRFGANIVLSTTAYAGSDPSLSTNQYGDADPFLVYGPGSYEIDGMSFKGFGAVPTDTPTTNGPETVYLFSMDGMRIAFLGGVMDRKQIPPEFFEAIDEIDLLFISAPDETKSGKEAQHAHSLVTSLSPKAVVPIGYGSIKDTHIQEFIKELGSEDVKGDEKLTIKVKDLSATTMAVYPLINV